MSGVERVERLDPPDRGSCRVLVVDDEREVRRSLGRFLTSEGYRVAEHASASEALAALAAEEFDVVVTDLSMPGTTGLDLCRKLLEQHPDVPVVLMTGFGSLESAVAAIRAGAFDYLTKPFPLRELELAVQRAARHRALHVEVRRLRNHASTSSPQGLAGTSAAMRRVNDVIARVAPLDTTVLFVGESGTGKELAARQLHDQSARNHRPFVAINCAALPLHLLESQLFGHARGAFTDAQREHRGLLEEADGGTIFFDEIGELPQPLQPKLLRVLQERSFRPLGHNRERAFNARVVAATNVDLEHSVARGTFREDLYYRLNVLCIEMPPLRDRAEDILLLAQSLLTKGAQRLGKDVRGFSPAAAERLLEYHWPGNVRELVNCVEHVLALTRHDHVTASDLPPFVGERKKVPAPSPSKMESQLISLAELERHHIRQVLEHAGGNKTEAARILGLERKTLYRRLSKYKLSSG